MRIFVTGANGLLGSSLCRLYQKKHEVHALHRDKKCFTTCTVDYSLDLRGFRKIQTLFNQIKPDLLIHCAGFTSVDGCEQEPALAYETNVMVCENIARACSNRIKLVHISTDQVYGKADDHSEANEKLQPLNQYGKTKLHAEQIIKEVCNDYLILRTNIFLVDRKAWTSKFCRVDLSFPEK